jgi:hypothetical protein
MWKKSFVATTVALGGSVDDALAALAPTALHPTPPRSAGELDALVAKLRAPQRGARAAALAGAVRDIVLVIDEITLR